MKVLVLAVFMTAHLFSHSFEDLMGKNTAYWKYVKTKEDKEKLAFSQKHYEKEKILLPLSMQVPKVLHFIWLGPKRLSPVMRKNIRTWIKKHPSYLVKLWTDYPRERIHKNVQIILVDEEALLLKEAYKDTINYVEKEDLLRLQILSQQGGVCIDPNIACLQPVDSFNQTSSFFAVLAPPHDTIGSSSIIFSNGILASIKHHRIIENAIIEIQQLWKKVGFQFALDDDESFLYRAFYRLHEPLERALQENIQDTDRILAAGYLYSFNQEPVLGKYTQESKWLKFKATEKDKLQRNIVSLHRSVSNQVYIYAAIFVLLALIAFSLFLRVRKS